jgi:proliferating cell nuclear antigen
MMEICPKHESNLNYPTFANLKEGELSNLFFAKTATSTEWKAVSSAIKTLVEEATFEANTESLSFRAMDPSHVALVDLYWPNSAFEKYECDKQFKFSMRVEDLVKLIGRSDTKDSVEISSTEGDAIMVKFMNGYKREYTVHLIDSSTGTAPLPKLEFDTKTTLTKSVFEKVLSDISVVSDQVTIHAAKDTLAFSGKSDVGAASIQLDKTGADVLDLQVKAESRATYNIDYLLSITKAMGNAADTLMGEFSTKKPIRLEFKLNDQGARVHYFLAPRVSE